VFIDVGSHIGSVIAEMRRRQPHLQIIAIEADPQKAAELSRKFRSITVHSCALGETSGPVAFYVDTERQGYSSLSPRMRDRDHVREISIDMQRLDDIVPATARVDLIKIDVEGTELGVLKGGNELIARCRPVVFFESGPVTALAGFTIEGLFDWFAERSYDVFVPDRIGHAGPPLGREGFVEAHSFPFRTLNYFAIPSERRIEIRERAREELGITPAN
jgi:FkbM family methyltransferase